MASSDQKKTYLFVVICLLMTTALQAQLKAVFAVDTTSGCAPFKVKITEKSTGNPAQYFWDFGNGQTSALRTPAVTYASPGVYTLTETVTSGTTQSTTSATIYARGVPANFSYTYKNICTTPATMSFVADSIDNITKYHWDFGDNNKSIGAQPANVYDNGGQYNVLLITISAQGCQDTSIQQVQVGGGNANFTIPDMTCEGAPVTFTNTSLPIPKNTTWSIDNTKLTSTDAVYTFTKTGNYTVNMVADFGTCQQKVTKQITVLASPVADFKQSGTMVSCNYPATVSFTNNSSNAASYQWLFGDGATAATQNATHTYTTAGIFDVSLVAFNANGCTDTLTKTALVKLGPPVISGFSNLPVSGCMPVIAKPKGNIISPDPITAYDWDFGDGTHEYVEEPAHTYNKDGYYRVTLTVSTASGCSGSYSLVQAVAVGAAPPVADFSTATTTICGNSPVQFNASANGTVTSWNWDFGDGGKATVQNPVYKYTNTGNFTVTLYVSDKGCPANVSKKNYLLVKPPIAKIEPVYYCDDRLRVDFKDQSIEPLTWNWDFGDGASSVNQNETHVYKKSGEYHVTLITTNGSCTSTTDTLITVVNNRPILTLQPGSGAVCRHDSLNITADSHNYIVDYLWNLDDGTTIFDNSNIQFAYKANGTYDPSLIVSYVNGCKDTSTLNTKIRVYGPTAGFSLPPAVCLNQPAVFTDTSYTDGLHAIKTWDWNSGDGAAIQQHSAAFSPAYTTAGTYIPALKITDAFGCADSVVAATPVTAKGIKAAFDYTAGNSTCDSMLYNFTNQSLLSNDVIKQYKWDFGDNDTSFIKDPQHYYTNSITAGTVMLMALTEGGCADTALKNITVAVAGSPEIVVNAPNAVCAQAPVSFTATQTGKTDVAIWQWNFDNGATSNTQNTTYTFVAPAMYEVQLVAASNTGCADTIIQRVTVHALPAVNAGDDMFVCKGQRTSLTATGAETYTWQPAANLTCQNCASPVTAPLSTTMYYVTGKDNNGCINKDSVFIKVQEQKQLSVNKSAVQLCAGDAVALAASGEDIYQWQPAAGLNNPNIANPVATPATTTLYTVTATDSAHCFTASAPVSVVVNNKPVFNIADSVLVLNKGAMQQLQTTSSADVIKWLWQPQQNLSCYNCAVPVLTANQQGTYTATATNAAGCSATDKVQVLLLCNDAQLLLPTAFTPNNDGRNDRFFPMSAGGVAQKIKSFAVFSNTGQMLFSKQNIYTNSYADGWDGMYKSNPLGTGVFIYIIELECNGKTIPFKGTVTIIR